MMKTLIWITAAVAAAGSTLLLTVVGAALALVALAGEGYGTRLEFHSGEVYYTSRVTEEEARNLIRYLDDNLAQVNHNITYQLDRNGEELLVRMCAQPKYLTSNDLDFVFQANQILLQLEYFPNDTVVFEVCDERMNPKKSFRDQLETKDDSSGI